MFEFETKAVRVARVVETLAKACVPICGDLRRTYAAVLAFLFFVAPASAQQFELVEPTGLVTGHVDFSRGQMIADDANGRRYVFQRDRSFDSVDHRYRGYIHPVLNRVVRWPRVGQGKMQVTDLDDVYPQYRFSRRTIRPVRGGSFRPPIGGGYLPPPVAYIPPSIPTYYSHVGYSGFGWPFGYSYGYQSFGTSLSVGPISGFAPIRPPGLWYPPPIQSIVLDSKIVPRQPLPPATLDLQNSSRREVIVTIADLAEGGGTRQLRIAPGTSSPEVFQRDAGADLVKTVQTYAPDGSIINRTITTPIPPQSRYELVVHERRVQSVAIDRTGKSPNVIEDVQYQGRGLGRFDLPPGEGLQSGSMDVIRTALSQGNQGTVAPIREDSDPRPGEQTRPPTSLEEMLLQQQRARR